MKINRFLPIWVAILSFTLFEVVFFFAKMIFVVFVLLIIFYLFVIRQFLLENRQKEKFYNLIIWPFCFLISAIIFSVLIPRSFSGDILLQTIFVINSWFTYIYFKSIYLYIIGAQEKVYLTLRNLSSYGLFLATYFFVSGIYGLQVFLNLKISYLMFALLFFFAAIIYQVFWSNKIKTKENLYFIFLMILVLVELSWSVSFLTLSFYIQGMIVAVSYYILIGMVRFYVTNQLTKRLVKLYLIFGFISISLVLFTSRWIGHG